LQPPPWASALVASSATTVDDIVDGLAVRQVVSRDGHLSFTSILVPDAVDLPAEAFRQAVIEAYAVLFDRVVSQAARHPLRFWNFLPAINDQLDDRRDRYMAFNEGRFAAFEARYGGSTAFDENVATASAVGHRGRDLVIHCLAGQEPGRHVGNPRQVAPHRYSHKYGPRPPCFARATVARLSAGERPLILVGGTASILGEDSRHVGDLVAQTEETLANMASLIESIEPAAGSLSRFIELRVYHPRAADASWLSQRVRSVFTNVARPELVRGDLCRAELLVEIEGVAELSGVEAK
jgi:chorismate lyase/3-hydroxybenzoate synthase